MLVSKEKNIPQNDKCIICKNYITIDDIKNKDYELVVTRRSKIYAHTSCIERRNKKNANVYKSTFK